MRLWSLHPSLLDAKGLVALWREGLLAKKVLEGKTIGYMNHPQLERFKKTTNPQKYINAYLYEVLLEAQKRNYKFDRSKIILGNNLGKLKVSSGQLKYELEHLKRKLIVRDNEKFQELNVSSFELLVHPLFDVFEGEIENWEIV